MRLLLLACILALTACGPAPQPVQPKRVVDDSLRGASLGAPEESPKKDAQSSQDDEELKLEDVRDIAKDIIVKNTDDDEEILVSPPNPRRKTNPLNALEALHKGQRVSDFADVSKIGSDGYLAIYFSKLSSYVYFQDFGDQEDNPAKDMSLFMQLHNQTEAEKGDKQIPEEIRALHGKKVAIPGFMLAANMKNGKTNDFLLVQVLPSCFFCRTPNVTEWVTCRAKKDEWLPFYFEKPVVVRGTLSVGSYYTDEYLEYIYKLDVESVELLKK